MLAGLKCEGPVEPEGPGFQARGWAYGFSVMRNCDWGRALGFVYAPRLQGYRARFNFNTPQYTLNFTMYFNYLSTESALSCYSVCCNARGDVHRSWVS